MPLPFILGAIAVVAGVAGGAKTCGAIADNNRAKDLNEEANNIAKRAKNRANRARKASSNAISALGKAKLCVLDQQIKPFVYEFEKIKNISLKDTQGIDELSKFKIDQQGIKELKELGDFASSMLGGLAGGGFAGAVTAFGAYSGTMALATASTGTAITTLSGVAATNATLAFLGGGAISAGGLGIAGGTAVLGGLVAGPALAVLGFTMAAKASANLDKARSNLAEARRFVEEMDTVTSLCNGIKDRAQLFENMLSRLGDVFEPMVGDIAYTVTTSGTDYRKYTDKQKKSIAVALSTASAIKTILDTPLLTKDGQLTAASATLSNKIMPVIEQFGG